MRYGRLLALMLRQRRFNAPP